MCSDPITLHYSTDPFIAECWITVWALAHFFGLDPRLRGDDGGKDIGLGPSLRGDDGGKVIGYVASFRTATYDLLMPLSGFHPAVAGWFAAHFDQPTAVQAQAWPSIRAGQASLIAAPTGSGKTLAAFLAAIDQLLVEGLAAPLPDETRVLYISPLKALSNDIHKNLELPLNGIRDQLLEAGLPDVPITARVRSGDTSSAERVAMKRTPPHILVTTPESLYILLTSDSGRAMLSTA